MCCWLCTLGIIAEDAMDAFILGARMPISVLGSSREALPTFTSYYPRLGLFVQGSQAHGLFVSPYFSHVSLFGTDVDHEVFTTQLKRTTWSRTAYLGPHSLNHSELVA